MDKEDYGVRNYLLEYVQETKLNLKYFERNTDLGNDGINEKIELTFIITGDKKKMYSELNKLIKKLHENT